MISNSGNYATAVDDGEGRDTGQTPQYRPGGACLGHAPL
jgi:hypothetical protein